MTSCPSALRLTLCLVLITFSTAPLALNAANEQAGETEPVAPPKWAVLKEAMRRDATGLEMVTKPGGHRSVHLKGRYLHMSAAIRDATGKLRQECFTSYDAMDNALRGRAPAKDSETEQKEHVEE